MELITECRMFEPYMAIPTPSMPTTPSIHPMNHADVVKIRIQKASIKVWRRRKVVGGGEDPALELLGLGLNWLILFVMWPCLVDAECVRGNNR